MLYVVGFPGDTVPPSKLYVIWYVIGVQCAYTFVLSLGVIALSIFVPPLDSVHHPANVYPSLLISSSSINSTLSPQSTTFIASSSFLNVPPFKLNVTEYLMIFQFASNVVASVPILNILFVIVPFPLFVQLLNV